MILFFCQPISKIIQVNNPFQIKYKLCPQFSLPNTFHNLIYISGIIRFISFPSHFLEIDLGLISVVHELLSYNITFPQ